MGTHNDTPYLVTELLEGETLRKRLDEGPLTVRKAVQIGSQIAHALAAAHERGIIHRDLKAENIFPTKDGQTKLLDFGLAKIGIAASSAGPDSVTKLSAATQPGVVMGTVGYMSAEQVRGDPTDLRSDIFSFGAVLYEMLGGKRAFTGDSSVETMTAILKTEPPELSPKAQIPPGLDRIVRVSRRILMTGSSRHATSHSRWVRHRAPMGQPPFRRCVLSDVTAGCSGCWQVLPPWH